jgi:hypothetical protein
MLVKVEVTLLFNDSDPVDGKFVVVKIDAIVDGTIVDKVEKNDSSNKQLLVVEKLIKYKATVLVQFIPKLIHKDKNVM